MRIGCLHIDSNMDSKRGPQYLFGFPRLILNAVDAPELSGEPRVVIISETPVIRFAPVNFQRGKTPINFYITATNSYVTGLELLQNEPCDMILCDGFTQEEKFSADSPAQSVREASGYVFLSSALAQRRQKLLYSFAFHAVQKEGEIDIISSELGAFFLPHPTNEMTQFHFKKRLALMFRRALSAKMEEKPSLPL